MLGNAFSAILPLFRGSSPSLPEKNKKNLPKGLIFPVSSDKIINAVFQDFLARRLCKMAKCDFCGKAVAFGIQVSHSHRRSNRPWKANVKRVKAIVNGTPTHVYVCTRCLRSGKVERA